MLNEFLKVAYEEQLRKESTVEVMSLLEKLPAEELRKLADGTPVARLWPHLEKAAYMDECKSDGTPKTWLDQFKGTPFLDQAIALEQEELQAEMTDIQKRQERRQQNKLDDNFYDMKDQIRMKKRLLELEKFKAELGATADTPAQGAGAPGPVPAEGVQDDSQGLGGGVAKSAAAVLSGTPQEKIAFADNLGRELARQDFDKAAHVELLRMYGGHAGAVMAKQAAGLGGMLASAAPLAQKALGFAAKNPAMAGAALGAAGGALAGGEGHRLSGALGGAALGHAAGGIGGRVMGGQSLGQAAKGYGGTLMGGGAPGARRPSPGGMADPSVLGSRLPTGSPMMPPNVGDFTRPTGMLGRLRAA
jgi:hypothetical protein